VRDTEIAVKKGFDSTKIEWRKMALETIYRLCAENEFLTANEFGEEIKANPLKTHENRAIGGVIIMARKFGWVENTGKFKERISKSFHKGAMNAVWKSLLFGRVERQIAERPQMDWHRGARTFVELGNGKYVVNGTQGKRWRVNAKPAGGFVCECPAFVYSAGKNGTCRHIKIIEKYLAEITVGAAAKAQANLF
jgi:hypothetical protein